MGFLPYKIESSKFVFSNFYFILSTILMIVYILFVIVSIYELNFQIIYDTSAYIHTNLIMTLGLLIFFWAYISNRSMIQVLQRVLEVSRMIPPKVFHDMAKWFYTKTIILAMPLLSFIPQIDNIFIMTCWYTFMGVLVLNNLYVYNVYVLSTCFRQINDSLVEVMETLINDRPHVLRRVYHTQENPVLLSKLRTLKKQHCEISNVVQMVNESFGRQNLTIITLLFIDITFNIYYYLVYYTENGRIKQWFSYTIMFVFYYIIHLILIVWAIEGARSQVMKIGSNIHRIIIRTFDEKVTDELEMFSLQVLQTDNTFSAKGLVIDATLLTKVLSTTTTYLLILIQMLVLKQC
ncbi:Putative gustatory receptor 28b [Anthophora plagiata]